MGKQKKSLSDGEIILYPSDKNLDKRWYVEFYNPLKTGFDYSFYDRSLGKSYPKTGKANGYVIMTFKPVINTIVEKFQK